MVNILIGVVIGIIGGLLIYRYFLDKPDKVYKVNKIKQRGKDNKQDVEINIDDEQPKCFIEISASMSWGEVKRLARERWKSIKNL